MLIHIVFFAWDGCMFTESLSNHHLVIYHH